MVILQLGELGVLVADLMVLDTSTRKHSSCNQACRTTNHLCHTVSTNCQHQNLVFVGVLRVLLVQQLKHSSCNFKCGLCLRLAMVLFTALGSDKLTR